MGLPKVTPKNGSETVYVADLDQHWVIACPFHRGEAVVGYETREDPETGEPRQATHTISAPDPDDPSKRKITVEVADAVFPVHSEKVGHVVGCLDCEMQLAEVRHAIANTRLDKDRGRIEENLRWRLLLARAEAGEQDAIDRVNEIQALFAEQPSKWRKRKPGGDG